MYEPFKSSTHDAFTLEIYARILFVIVFWNSLRNMRWDEDAWYQFRNASTAGNIFSSSTGLKIPEEVLIRGIKVRRVRWLRYPGHSFFMQSILYDLRHTWLRIIINYGKIIEDLMISIHSSTIAQNVQEKIFRKFGIYPHDLSSLTVLWRIFGPSTAVRLQSEKFLSEGHHGEHGFLVDDDTCNSLAGGAFPKMGENLQVVLLLQNMRILQAVGKNLNHRCQWLSTVPESKDDNSLMTNIFIWKFRNRAITALDSISIVVHRIFWTLWQSLADEAGW